MEIEDFAAYLQRRYKKSTVRSYMWAVGQFLSHFGTESLAALQYQNIMDYISKLRGEGQHPNHIYGQIASIKILYKFLIRQGECISNPAYDINLLDSYKAPLQFQNLLTPEELNMLLWRKERYKALENRNKIIMSLLVHNALHVREILSLRISDVVLDHGNIFIRAHTNSLARVMNIEPTQLYAFENYIKYERPQLLKKGQPTDILLLSKLGKCVGIDSIQCLCESAARKLFPNRKLTTVTIRESVLANKFRYEGWGLREVQLFSGIKYMSTALKYKPQDRQALYSSLMRFHPMA